MPLAAQEAARRLLTVTGQGIERTASSLADVSLGLEARATTATEAQSQVNQAAERLLKFLKAQTVQDLQTSQINLSPQYRYPERSAPVLDSYAASYTVSFRVPLTQAGGVLDQALRQGATRINGVTFAASEGAIAQAREKALKSAIQDAQAQARVVLSDLGFSPQTIVGIQINGSSIGGPRPFPMMRANADQAASVPIEGGEQEVRASVTLQIQY
jgi:uncharacterized protein YggE